METKESLNEKRKVLHSQIIEIDNKLVILENLEKPYVANVSGYSGHYATQFVSEDKARKKMNEYFGKQYFKNGLNYGVYLYKWNEDGTKTLLEVKPKGSADFYPIEFKSQ